MLQLDHGAVSRETQRLGIRVAEGIDRSPVVELRLRRGGKRGERPRIEPRIAEDLVELLDCPEGCPAGSIELPARVANQTGVVAQCDHRSTDDPLAQRLPAYPSEQSPCLSTRQQLPKSPLPGAARKHDHRRPPAKHLGIVNRARLPADLGKRAPELLDGAVEKGWVGCHGLKA